MIHPEYVKLGIATTVMFSISGALATIAVKIWRSPSNPAPDLSH